MVCFFYKGSQKNCTDTEGNQYQRPQSEANSSINSLHRWCRWCIEQGSNLPMVKCWTVGRARHKLKNTRSPGLIIITGSPFFAFRSCWMPCTDQDKFLPMDGSIGRHLAATAGRPGAMSYLLAYLLRSLLMDKEFGRINQQPTVILWSSRPSYLEANALSIVFLVQSEFLSHWSSWGLSPSLWHRQNFCPHGGNGVVWIHSRRRGEQIQV